MGNTGVPNQADSNLTRLVREMLSEQRPLGAYKIAQLIAQHTGRPAYANTVYRIIAPMVRAGEVIPVASAKGWVLADCRWDQRLILLCEQCQIAEQVPATSIAEALHVLCSDQCFYPQQNCLEVLGLCQNCGVQADDCANRLHPHFRGAGTK
jgi:Fur family transcriptional regulator, zinc uptake regulator